MLTLTDNAVMAIRDLTVGENIPDQAGLRLAPKPGEETSLELSLVSAPQAGDQVIEQADTRVFVDPGVAPALDDKTLDADIGAEGAHAFKLMRR
ncbi:iron-sulfur cluster assembly accessory protein [Microbispora sp. H11081]|uniref:HesB/IscA family protein n=1 Tax=Microbispora sp. H11081 TaxID=2729107 RepID=UPI001473B443|nr:Fe-S cluster assembly protein HesB [Microbispora sp. H11081]